MPQTGLRKIVAESSHVNISPFGHSKLEGHQGQHRGLWYRSTKAGHPRSWLHGLTRGLGSRQSLRPTGSYFSLRINQETNQETFFH